MGNIAKNAFPVLNMHCAGCASNVEKTVKKLPGVVDASVNFASNTLTISYEDDKLTPGEIRAAVLAAGYDLIVEEANKEEREETPRGNPYDERPCDAGSLSDGSRPYCGNDRRPTFLRLP